MPASKGRESPDLQAPLLAGGRPMSALAATTGELEALLEAARGVLRRALERKAEIEREGPIDDLTWQYASAIVEGCRRVVRAIEGALPR